MSWPPQNSDLAYKVLKTMRKVNPECILIYIGEKKVAAPQMIVF